MSERTLVLGKRYKLDHGYGTLLGREVFDKDGNTASLDTEDLRERASGRFIFMLEKGHSWIAGSFPYDNEPKKYAAWGKHIKEVDDE